MSMHKKPLTDLERGGLEAHGLPIGKPSQLSDCFRSGVVWAGQRIAELEEREAALTAHIEGLKPALEDFASGLGTCCCGDDMNRHGSPMDAGHMPTDSGWYAMECYMRDKPDTSNLAKRDLTQRAEEIESAAAGLKESWPQHDGKYHWLIGRAHGLRQQAEQC